MNTRMLKRKYMNNFYIKRKFQCSYEHNITDDKFLFGCVPDIKN